MSLEFKRVGEASAELLTRIHEECFPKYWNREAFTDFFEVKNTFAVVAFSPSLRGAAGDAAIQPKPHGGGMETITSQTLGCWIASPAARNDGEPAGMMVYRVVGEQADIITLAVRPAFRRAKLAQKLLSDALNHCKELGAEAMFLEVEEGNEPAIRLYEQAGFSRQGRRKLYYQQLNGTYTDALVMRRKLR